MRLLKIPLNAGALNKKQGQEKAPDNIIEHLKDFHLSENGFLPVFDIVDVMIDNSNISEAHDMIERVVSKQEGNCILIGGDHSLTYPAFKAFSKNNPDSGIVVFDAHPNLQDKSNPSNNKNYLRTLIEEGIVDKNKVIIIGNRNMSKEEAAFIKQNKIKHYSMREISFEYLREITDAVMSVAKEWNKLYLSIDINVLDPAFAPGTGYQEPGGMSTRDLLYCLHRFKMLRNLRIIDIVEVNPDKDHDEITSKTAAKIIVEMS